MPVQDSGAAIGLSWTVLPFHFMLHARVSCPNHKQCPVTGLTGSWEHGATENSSVTALAVWKTLSQTLKFKSELFREAAAIANWATVSSISAKLNPNVTDFFN